MEQWEAFLQEQEKTLGKEVVAKWLRCLKVSHFDACNLYLEAEDAFQISWFEEQFRPLIKTKLLNNNHHPIKVHLTTTQELKKGKGKKRLSSSDVPFIKIDSDPLLEKATFESFIPGEKNALPLKFLMDLQLGAFNPVFLHGIEGTGKTHLLMACAKNLLTKGISAFYVHAETFTEHVVRAIRSSQMQEFRKIYRHSQVLLIDDVHILSRKAATQEELFHTFNTFHTQGRQIILSSHLPPSRLTEIEPRLISRFEWGILFHLEKLTRGELKQVVLNHFSKTAIPIDEQMIDFLISLFPKGIKSLFNALELLTADYKKHLQTLTKERIEMVLAKLIQIEFESQLTPEKIVRQVADYFGIKPSDILGKSQVHEYTLARQIAMDLCRTKLKMPYLKIGRFFSRDHSTVMFSIKQIQLKKQNPENKVFFAFQDLETKLES